MGSRIESLVRKPGIAYEPCPSDETILDGIDVCYFFGKQECKKRAECRYYQKKMQEATAEQTEQTNRRKR